MSDTQTVNKNEDKRVSKVVVELFRIFSMSITIADLKTLELLMITMTDIRTLTIIVQYRPKLIAITQILKIWRWKTP